MKHNTFHFGAVTPAELWHKQWVILSLQMIWQYKRRASLGHLGIPSRECAGLGRTNYRVDYHLPVPPCCQRTYFWRLFLCFSSLSLPHHLPRFLDLHISPDFHSEDVYAQLISELQFSLMHFPRDRETSPWSRTSASPNARYSWKKT